MAKKTAAEKKVSVNGRSLPFVAFQLSLSSEIRLSYYCRVSFAYAGRWWDHLKAEGKDYKRLTDYPGDNGRPYSSISIPVEEFLGPRLDEALDGVRGNAIVNCHTAFETYMVDILKRSVFLVPRLVEDSGVALTVADIVPAIDTGDSRRWLADKIAHHYMFNKSHREMLKWFGKALKADISKSSADLVDRWEKWSLVRNQLIHTGRATGASLAAIWPERFATRGLDDSDITSCHTTAFELAAAIDAKVMASVIGERDARLFIKEVFVRFGTDDPAALSRVVWRVMGAKLSKSAVQAVLAEQRKAPCEPLKECSVLDSVVAQHEARLNELSALPTNGPLP